MWNLCVFPRPLSDHGLPTTELKFSSTHFYTIRINYYIYVADNMGQGRQIQGGGGVAEVTKIDVTTWVNFLKRSTFYDIYAKRLKMVYFYAKRLKKTYF